MRDSIESFTIEYSSLVFEDHSVKAEDVAIANFLEEGRGTSSEEQTTSTKAEPFKASRRRSNTCPEPMYRPVLAAAASATGQKLETFVLRQKVERLRSELYASIPAEYKKALAVLRFYENLLASLNEDDAAREVANSMATSTRNVKKWVVAAEKDESLLRLPDEPVLRSAKRVWLLEEYPRLQEQAREWTRQNLERALEEGRRFKITEFQKWVNNFLLKPLIDDTSSNVKPISHSTARAWIKRLGYNQKQMEDQPKASPDVDLVAEHGSNLSRKIYAPFADPFVYTPPASPSMSFELSLQPQVAYDKLHFGASEMDLSESDDSE